MHKALQTWGAILLTAASLWAAEANTPHSVALFVANRGEPELNEMVPVFEDLLTAQVTGLGFQVISRDVSLGAISGLEQAGRTNQLDAVLDEASSSLQLARNLGARYILMATIDGMIRETRTVKAYGVSFQNQDFALLATYRIVNGQTGAAISAGSVTPNRTLQQSQHVQISSDGIVRQLLAAASRDIAANLESKGGSGLLEDVAGPDGDARFQISVILEDVTIPEVSLGADGQARVTANRVRVLPVAVPVELDGILVGTTGSGDKPATFQAQPGLHRLRLARGDLEPVERMINVRQDLNLTISMRLSEEGRQAWLEDTTLLQGLKAGATLTEAQAEALRGLGQMLRQSGLRVETDEGITIERNQSLMHQD